MSTIAVSLPSKAAMVDVISTASSDAVGEVASDYNEPSHCFIPSAHARPLIVLSLFSLRNISDSRRVVFCSLLSLLASRGVKVSFVCNCMSSFETADYPFSLNFFIPFFIEYCGMMW
jgi:hypothetical protein